MSLVYLAAPYSDPDPDVVKDRITEFCRCDAALNKQGIFTVSPLLKHLVLQHSDLPSDWNYWKDYSLELLKQCEKMIVIMMDGWTSSIGVLAEINLCHDMGIPIEYIDPDVLLGRK